MAISPKLTVSGVPFVLKGLDMANKRIARGIERGLIRAGLHLLSESQRIVPVDKGILIKTGKSIPHGKGFDMVVTVGYGTDYGVYVHEITTSEHKPGKTAKFLERPMRTERPKMLKIIQEEAKKT